MGITRKDPLEVSRSVAPFLTVLLVDALALITCIPSKSLFLPEIFLM